MSTPPGIGNVLRAAQAAVAVQQDQRDLAVTTAAAGQLAGGTDAAGGTGAAAPAGGDGSAGG